MLFEACERLREALVGAVFLDHPVALRGRGEVAAPDDAGATAKILEDDGSV
jgi:hypothetical protein